MRRLLGMALGGALGLALIAGPAAADDRSDAIAVIHRFTQTLDRGVFISLCARDAVLVEHVPPYVFQGPNACGAYWDAVMAWAARQKLDVTDWGTPAEPEFVDITGDRIYAVFDLKASGTREGKAFVEPAKWTFVVRREPEGWRIAAASWSTIAITFAK